MTSLTPIRRRQVTMLESDLAAAKKQDRKSVADFLYWRFPDLKRLEDLRKLQREEREYLESIERNGATGRAVEFLRSMLDSREIEIKALQASGRFPVAQENEGA
jgi:hypothetical protein